jgi:hypothetical protein
MKRQIVLAACFLLMTVIASAEMFIDIPVPPDAQTSPSEKQGEMVKKSSPSEDDDSSGAEKDNMDLISFINGDAMHGKLIGAQTTNGVEWKSPFSGKNTFFDMNYIASIKLGAKENKKTGEARLNAIVLSNHDSLFGKILKLDDEFLTLDTESAGRLEIKREAVAQIIAKTSSGLIYKGPNGDDKWKVAENSGGKFSIEKGILKISRNCGIGIEIKIPDMIKLEFEASAGSSFNLTFFSDKISSYAGNGYMLTLNQNQVYMQVMRGNRGGSRNLGNAELGEIPFKPFVRFAIFADRKNKSFSLAVEDRVIHKWFDNIKDECSGNAFVFQNNHGGSSLHIKNIAISKWDGGSETKIDEEKPASDIIVFANNDKVTGKVLKIAGDELTFKTDFALLDVPLERISKIILRGSKEEKITPDSSDIKAFFDSNNGITLKKISISDGIIKAQNPCFGSAEFKLSSFAELKFQNASSDEPGSVKNPDNDENTD